MNNQNNGHWIRPFLVSLLGTSIGVALTFFVNGMVARHNKEQAQRLTAIMVIHDIDNTIDILKDWKEEEEEGQRLFLYVQEHMDQEETIPADTVSKVFERLVKSSTVDYSFDTSKEKIFNSDVDIWQNLGNMKFIDNVQEIFNERQGLIESTRSTAWFSKPISAEDYMPIIMRRWTSQEEYDASRWSFLKQKMQEKLVAYYISVSYYRVSSLGEMIDKFTRLNDENKFIMGITDQELDDYVNSISNKGIALIRSQLPGRWLFASKNQRLEYDFRSDKGFSITNVLLSEFKNTRFWSGSFKILLQYQGKWAVQGDSLVLSIDFNTVDVQLDQSDIIIKENMQDSTSLWMEKYRENLVDYFREDMEGKGEHVAYKARMDSSKDKMEWTNADGEVRYMKRQEETN